MSYQEPAEGIMITGNYTNSRSYLVECECSDPSHAAHMYIEADNDTKDVTLEFYVSTRTPDWKSGFSRIKTAWNVLTKGYHESENHLVLNQQSAINLAKTIENTIKQFEKTNGN